MQYLSDILPTGSLREIAGGLHGSYRYLKLLCCAVCCFCGLWAGLRVYSLWNIQGRAHVHIDAEVIAWTAAAVFFGVAAFFIEAVFPVG